MFKGPSHPIAGHIYTWSPYRLIDEVLTSFRSTYQIQIPFAPMGFFHHVSCTWSVFAPNVIAWSRTIACVSHRVTQTCILPNRPTYQFKRRPDGTRGVRSPLHTALSLCISARETVSTARCTNGVVKRLYSGTMRLRQLLFLSPLNCPDLLKSELSRA